MIKDIGCSNTSSPNAHYLCARSMSMLNCNWRHTCDTDMVFHECAWSCALPDGRTVAILSHKIYKQISQIFSLLVFFVWTSYLYGVYKMKVMTTFSVP